MRAIECRRARGVRLRLRVHKIVCTRRGGGARSCLGSVGVAGRGVDVEGRPDEFSSGVWVVEAPAGAGQGDDFQAASSFGVDRVRAGLGGGWRGGPYLGPWGL